MYKIEKASFGYRLSFGDSISANEMEAWVEESKKILESASGKFGIMVDMRTLKPLMPDAQEKMEDGQKLYASKGMERSVVILANSVLTMQFKRIAKETGIDAFERYIDSSSKDNWEELATNWLAKGIDPDA